MSSQLPSTVLASLRAHLKRFDEQTALRGRTIFRAGGVGRRWTQGTALNGEVTDTDTFITSLGHKNAAWTATCTCPIVDHCKHAYALALAWLDNPQPTPPATKPVAAKPTATAAAATTAARPAAPTEAVSLSRPGRLSVNRPPFREYWTPILAQKLGRRLVDDEARLLGKLGALHAQIIANGGRLFGHQLVQNGFPTPQATSGSGYEPVHSLWWETPPADPWELWQYLAFDMQMGGQPLPEVFVPMTDTSAVRARLESRFLQSELQHWREGLHQATAPAGPSEAARGVSALRLRLTDDGWRIELQPGAGKPFKTPTAKWLRDLPAAELDTYDFLPPAQAALATLLVAEARRPGTALLPDREPGDAIVRTAFRSALAREAIVGPDETPWSVEPAALTYELAPDPASPGQLRFNLVDPEGRPIEARPPLTTTPEPLFLVDGRLFRGPPALPRLSAPEAILRSPDILGRLRGLGVKLPASFSQNIDSLTLEPRLECSLADDGATGGGDYFCVRLLATATKPACEQEWTDTGWGWVKGKAAPERGDGDRLLEIDLSRADRARTALETFQLRWNEFGRSWRRPATATFPQDFLAWRAALPDGVELKVAPELRGLLKDPVKATLAADVVAADDARDWFDVQVALRTEDTTLTEDEIALLVKAHGEWVRLPGRGWERLALTTDAQATAALDRLGLHTEDVLETARPVRHRLHALQLAGEAHELLDAIRAAELRERVAALTTHATAVEPPASLQATLRPYQREGFQFLSWLAAHGFGGVLADDMGLGKTVQTLAWLLHLLETPPPVATSERDWSIGPRFLVICPKSVVHGWLTESARFAPTLRVMEFSGGRGAAAKLKADLVVANYAQLRQHAAWFAAHGWEVAILDEGQFIKNPSSQVAVAARAVPARHRVVLTGTPIENRLLDLWSLFAFAQPGLLGTQSAFRRQYAADDADALGRLRHRVRHFLLRRTKAQVAPDLPPRIEDDLVVELEGEQLRLYNAELKHARTQLLGLDSDRALGAVRFNILASLLRLRQICCHPALIDPAHRELPSAKLEALMERLEELRDEGHQVLVFSQFTTMLDLIRERLEGAGIDYLLLTGQTDNRQELVEKFQSDKSKTVFLLSLRAAGFGLNLTAASYAILYDPWWNPAVEAQAIDRAHRIGQTQPVVAYRLLAQGTVEEKIRSLQREKATLAESVVQEESLAQVMDLDTLRQILA